VLAHGINRNYQLAPKTPLNSDPIRKTAESAAVKTIVLFRMIQCIAVVYLQRYQCIEEEQPSGCKRHYLWWVILDQDFHSAGNNIWLRL
jgi:hypothetical protein